MAACRLYMGYVCSGFQIVHLPNPEIQLMNAFGLVHYWTTLVSGKYFGRWPLPTKIKRKIFCAHNAYVYWPLPNVGLATKTRLRETFTGENIPIYGIRTRKFHSGGGGQRTFFVGNLMLGVQLSNWGWLLNCIYKLSPYISVGEVKVWVRLHVYLTNACCEYVIHTK